jgi:hypothetical protein
MNQNTTWNQKRRLVILFQQYADKINVHISDTRSSNKFDSTRQLDSRLTIESLRELLSNIGPLIDANQAKKFVLEYDSSCTGTLGLDDFIEFMGDYILVLGRAKEIATDHYNDQEDENFIETFPTIEDYLLTVGLEDPVGLVQTDEPISKLIQESFFLSDTDLLKRHVSIRVFCALDVTQVAKLKPQRANDAIQFLSLDPFVRIELANMSQETTIITNTLSPHWDQTLDFVLEIPMGVITDIQQWVHHQNLKFFLYDANESGLVPSNELIGFASIPLIRVLLDRESSKSLTLELKTTACSKGPKLQVSIQDRTHEKYHWTKVLDSYLSNEDVWLMKYADKLKFDLGRYSLPKLPENVKSQSMLTDRIWALFISTLESLKNLFPLRNFSLVMLDEFNTFRFLCAFIRPISSEFRTMEEAASAVANIPFEQTLLSPQWGGNTLKYSSLDSISTWMMGNTGDVATETLVGQVASPSTILVRRKASLIEHAILLCCFFRGMKIESYVAVGEVQHRPYAWVVSMFPFSEQATRLRTPKFKPSERFSSSQFVQYGEHCFEARDFSKYNQLVEESQSAKESLLLHWDPLTGTPFSSESVPFDVLHTLFDETNQYFNVNPTVRPNQYYQLISELFSWSIQNIEKWVPFLTQDLVVRPGQVACYCTDDLCR